MTLRESGVTAFFYAFFGREHPVNLNLCRKLGLPESTFGVSIPLGATINMAGAAITIIGFGVGCLPQPQHSGGCVHCYSSLGGRGALRLRCGGRAGGSLMLIPLACSLFGIDNGTAMQVVAVGFIIGVLQDSRGNGSQFFFGRSLYGGSLLKSQAPAGRSGQKASVTC